MAILRIKTAELERMVDERYRSEEKFIRAADISRSAWNNLRDQSKQRVDLRILASVLRALDATLADVLEYDPDDTAH